MKSNFELRVGLSSADLDPIWSRLVLTDEFHKAVMQKHPNAIKALEWHVSLMIKDIIDQEIEKDATKL